MTAMGEDDFGYYLFKDKTKNITKYDNKNLKIDGHPSFIGENTFITDTYPQGVSNYQSLFEYKINGETNRIAKLRSHNFNYGEVKCDLHPRYDSGLKKIAVDSSPNGKRKMYIFDF